MKEAIKLLEQISFVPPGPRTLASMESLKKQRTLKMDHLQQVDGQCAWCNIIPLYSRRKKYCGVNCRNSALFYCYPQTPSAKMWVFIHKQNCSCTLCGECFEDKIAKKIFDLRKRWDKDAEFYKWKAGPITYHSLGDNTGDVWQVDHIIPLHKGGDGIGLENIQVVCKSCHLRKTIYERSY